jgi:DNA adenine methylase
MEKSFLKWAGSKYRLLNELLPVLTSFIDPKIKNQTFIEPFVGSGTVFLNMSGIDNFILADNNSNLLNLYLDLQKNYEHFIEHAKKYFIEENNNVEAYKKLVAYYNSQDITDAEKGYLFIYLNRHCFNGLMRFNKSGRFNTPFGRYKSPQFPEQSLQIMRDKIHNHQVQFMQADFSRVMENIKYGDIVYCDPPYVSSFNQYGSDLFGMEQQKNLAYLATQGAKRGAKVVISNHYNEITKELYKDCSEYKVVSVRRSIASRGEHRGHVEEIIAVYAY